MGHDHLAVVPVYSVSLSFGRLCVTADVPYLEILDVFERYLVEPFQF